MAFITNCFRKSTPCTTTMKVAMMRLSGTIKDSGLCLNKMNRTLEDAFKMSSTQAIAIVINSPGGSPTQSELLYHRICSLKKQYSKHVIVFAEDAAASGGYMVACAGDELYACSTSMIGSIGVIGSSIGLKKLAEKIGVENRMFIKGENKCMMDPFSDVSESQREIIDEILTDTHEEFKAIVIASRGERLKEHKDLFSGRVWSGKKAKELGLIDGIGNYVDVLKEKYGSDVKIEEVEVKKGWMGSLMSMLGLSIGTTLSESLVATIETSGLKLM